MTQQALLYSYLKLTIINRMGMLSLCEKKDREKEKSTAETSVLKQPQNHYHLIDWYHQFPFIFSIYFHKSNIL